jgi:nitrite reductase/ring-hydroxylating ferredoxin subunit
MDAGTDGAPDTAQGTWRTLESGIPVQAEGDRLVRVADLGPDQVVEVQTSEHGTIAVGMADGRPFATGNICRHQAAKLGRGQVRDGCLECPWHRARYDVRTGKMVQGPQGRIFGFPPYSWGIQLWANTLVRLRTFDVRVEDGWIVLA